MVREEDMRRIKESRYIEEFREIMIEGWEKEEVPDLEWATNLKRVNFGKWKMKRYAGYVGGRGKMQYMYLKNVKKVKIKLRQR